MANRILLISFILSFLVVAIASVPLFSATNPLNSVTQTKSLLNQPRATGEIGENNQATSTSFSTVQLLNETLVFGRVPVPDHFGFELLPANTVVWESFLLNHSAFLDTVGSEVDVPQSAYNSTAWVGLYVNSSLKYQSSTVFPKPLLTPWRTFIPADEIGVVYVAVQTQFPAGTILTISMAFNASIIVSTTPSGSTNEMLNVVSLPTHLPSIVNVTLPYTIDISGDSFVR